MSDDYRDERMGTDRMRLARNTKMTPVEIGALIFAVVWVLICIVFFFGLGGAEPGTEKNGVGFVLVVASVLVPIAVVWLAVSSARSARIMTDESERLQASMAAMRKVMIEVQEFQALGAPRAEEKTQRIEKAEPAKLPGREGPAMFASSRPHGEDAPSEAEKPGPEVTGPEMVTPEKPAAKTAATEPQMRDVSPAKTSAAAPAQPEAAPEADKQDDTQPSLEFGTPKEEAGEVKVDDLIRAINFPENAEDEKGFEALRRTLVDRRVATLIQAAQDVLTLLSQDGIYMDDLTPKPTQAKLWRQFAGGTRGNAVAELGAIDDRSSLALSAGRMKSDPIFRDAALHFLRQFDDVLSGFEPGMSDDQMERFAGTRTARAFMLLGRVTGAFE